MRFPTKFDSNRHGNKWLTPIPQGFHPGVDFNFGFGSDDEGQDVVAISDGVIKHVALCKGWGNHIIIYHPEYKAWSHYAHLKDSCVKITEEIKEGQLIGHLGTTGNSTAPHLHFEIRLIDIPSEKYVTGLTIEDVQKKYSNPENWINEKMKERNMLIKNINIMKLIKDQNDQTSTKIFAIGKDNKKHWIVDEATFAAGKEIGFWEGEMKDVQPDRNNFLDGFKIMLSKYDDKKEEQT